MIMFSWLLVLRLINNEQPKSIATSELYQYSRAVISLLMNEYHALSIKIEVPLHLVFNNFGIEIIAMKTLNSREEIVGFLQTNRTTLEKTFDVKSIALFGSWARGEQKSGSDIDLLVQFNNPTFSSWAGLKIFLEQNLSSKVDLVTQGRHLSERFLKHINRAIVHV